MSSGEPLARTLPASSRTTRAARAASFTYVVLAATAAPSAAAPAMSRHRSARLTGSTPVVGSSITSSSGACMRASPTASLRCGGT